MRIGFDLISGEYRLWTVHFKLNSMIYFVKKKI